MGKKTGAINDAIKDTEKEVAELIEKAMDIYITTMISNTLQKVS
jgi:hypothetical protein